MTRRDRTRIAKLHALAESCRAFDEFGLRRALAIAAERDAYRREATTYARLLRDLLRGHNLRMLTARAVMRLGEHGRRAT